MYGGFGVGGEIVRFEIVRVLGFMKVACDGRRRKVGIVSGWAGIALAVDSVSSMVKSTVCFVDLIQPLSAYEMMQFTFRMVSRFGRYPIARSKSIGPVSGNAST